jgi:LPS export ABC transporter protein LptC
MHFSHVNTLRWLILLVFPLLLSSCVSDIKKINEIASQKEIGDENGSNVEVNVMEEGYVRVKIQAPETLRHMNGENKTEFNKGVKAFTYNPQHKVESWLTAKNAVLQEQQDQVIWMKVKNDVIVVNSKGEKLNTEELTWDAKAKKISSDAFVKITTKDEIIFGNGFVSNEDFSEYTIKKITGTIAVKDNSINNTPPSDSMFSSNPATP